MIEIFEIVSHLFPTEMFVIAFASFIVVAKDAPTVRNQIETVFESVTGPSQRSRNVPDYDINESCLSYLRSFLADIFGFHVVN